MITTYEFVNAWVKAHIKSERGASLVEYALLVALIAVVCIAAVTTLGKSASSKFSTVGASILDTLVGGSGGTNTLHIPGLVLQAESGSTNPFSSTVGATETADATKFRPRFAYRHRFAFQRHL